MVPPGTELHVRYISFGNPEFDFFIDYTGSGFSLCVPELFEGEFIIEWYTLPDSESSLPITCVTVPVIECE